MTKAFKFSHKILLAAALIVVVAFAGFVAFNDYRQRQTLRNATENSMQELGTLTTRNIQSWLEGRMLLLQSMGLQIGATGTQVDKLTPVIGQSIFVSNFVLSYFGGQDGLMFSIPAGSRAADYDPRARGWYKAADAAQKTIVTEPYIAASSGKLVITVASPVQRDSKMAGIAAADIDLTTISDIINSLNFEGHGHAFILNSAGKILVHPDAKLVLKNLSDAYPNGTPQLSNSLKEVEVNGKTQFILFTQMKGISSADWYVALVLDKDAAFASLSELRTTAIIATVIAVLIIIVLLSLLIGILMKPLLLMGRAMQDIADGDGDLTKRLTIQNEDEFGALGNSFNRFVERIHNSIREVSSAADQVNEVAKLVVSASNSSISSSDQQVSRTTSVAAAINELGAAAQEIAQNAALASQHSSEANKLATDGQVTVNKTISAMNMLSEKIRDSCANIETLNDKTANIGKILEVITGISQQTNLLALNAAIEAARAGEAGRGFAVVADEVRSLAHRTQASAQQVQTMIEELQVGAKAAVGTMTESQYHSESSVGIANQAGASLNSVTQRIGEIEGMNHSVATATEEQTAVVESINVDITQINALNEQGVSNLKSTLSACSDLERQAARLKQLVDSFRI